MPVVSITQGEQVRKNMSTKGSLVLLTSLVLAPACTGNGMGPQGVVPVSSGAMVETSVGAAGAHSGSGTDQEKLNPLLKKQEKHFVWSSPKEAANKAEQCFEDRKCDSKNAALWYEEAEVQKAENLNCFRRYYGDGVAKDKVKARRCFEQKANAVLDGEGSSCDIDMFYWGLMAVVGDGGPVDIATTKEKLTSKCFEDISVSGILEEAHKPAQNRPENASDFCVHIGGTTLSMMGCSKMTMSRKRTELADVERQLLALGIANLDTLITQADDAWDAYAKALANWKSDEFRGGTMQGISWGGVFIGLMENQIEHRRWIKNQQLPPNAENTAPSAVQSALAKAVRDAPDQQAKDLINKTQVLYSAARNAEKDLWLSVASKDKTRGTGYLSQLDAERREQLLPEVCP